MTPRPRTEDGGWFGKQTAWALDHEIPFERNLEFFPYEYESAVLRWTPDFLLADGTYIEVKGYLSRQAEAKFDYFYRPLRVLTKTDPAADVRLRV